MVEFVGTLASSVAMHSWWRNLISLHRMKINHYALLIRKPAWLIYLDIYVQGKTKGNLICLE